MPRKILKIESIMDGISPIAFEDSKNGYHLGVGIDPDRIDSTTLKTSGIIKPSGYTKFSGSNVTGVPLWMTTNPKTENFYTYLSNGRLVRYTSALASETLVSTAATSSGNGMAYYNNWLYLFRNTDVDREGPLDGTAAPATDVWTGTTLGSQIALSNKTYPTIRQVAIPNHPAHVHSDGALYFGDVTGTGAGVIHKIKTASTLNYDGQTGNFTVGLVVTGATSKATAAILADADSGTTGKLTLGSISGHFQDNETITDTSTGSATVNGTLVQGELNDGSAYNVLDLPVDMWPTAIESLGDDLVIAAISSNVSGNPTTKVGNGALYFWDTISDTFYDVVPLKDALVTALKNINGKLYVFSGSATSGCRISVYSGADSLVDQAWFDDMTPPLQGAVSSLGDKVVFGTSLTYPSALPVVVSYRSKDARFKSGFHVVARSTSLGTSPLVGSICVQRQDAVPNGQLVIGWGDSTGYGLDKWASNATLVDVRFRKRWHIGEEFAVMEIAMPLDSSVSANTSLTTTVYTDNLSDSQALTEINNTNFSGKRVIVYKRPELTIRGKDDLILDLAWLSTNPIGVKLPIEVTIMTRDIKKTI